MAAVTFKDNYVIMTSCRWIFNTRQANFIVLVTDEISLLNFVLMNGGFFLSYQAQFRVDEWWIFFCHTRISGATTNTDTSTIPNVKMGKAHSIQ